MFNERIREARQQCGLTQKQVAEKLGITDNALCQYEKGVREPSISTIIELCKLYDVSADYLLGLTDDY